MAAAKNIAAIRPPSKLNWNVLSVQRAAEHSLFLRQNSLFFEIISLLASLGNCSNNRCGAAVSCSEIGGLGRKATIFPVKFPVCRESEWRLVRTALGRQPASATFLDRYGGIAERPANSGLSGIGASSPRSQSVILSGQIAESLQPTARIFPFSGDYRRRLGSIATAA